MSPTILELAANVRQKQAELDATCSKLREASGNWPLHALAGEEALKIAVDGLRNCWCMLARLDEIARDELKRSLEPNEPLQPSERSAAE